MTTLNRSKVSHRNNYYISEHRFLELKHFCLQYNEWKRAVTELGLSEIKNSGGVQTFNVPDPTFDMALELKSLNDRIKMVEDTVLKAAPTINTFLLMKVIDEKITYEYMRTMLNIPCSRGYFYKCYRRFFYILDGVRK